MVVAEQIVGQDAVKDSKGILVGGKGSILEKIMTVGGRIPVTVQRPTIIQIMSGESNAIIDPDLYTAPMSILGKGWREINEVIVYQAHMSACRDRNRDDRMLMFLAVGLETSRDLTQH